MSRRHASSLLLLLLLLSSSCGQSPPTGQVVARVDGVEVTRRDLLIELMASGAPADVDTQAAQPALLDRIVVRKLLTEEARRQSIDRSPEFLGQERRSQELILGEQLVQRVIGRLPPPSPAAIDRFVTAKRSQFDRRQIFRIDRITIAASPDAALMRLSSNDLIADRLHERKRVFDRVLVTIDSMTLSPAQRTVLDAAHGRPFLNGAGDAASIDQVVAAVPSPPAPAQRAALATDLLRDMAARNAIEAMTAQLRATAHIDYASGQRPHQIPGQIPAR